jgi:hypothetical protein
MTFKELRAVSPKGLNGLKGLVALSVTLRIPRIEQEFIENKPRGLFTLSAQHEVPSGYTKC